MYAEKYMTKCTQRKCEQNFKQRAYRLHIQIINIIIIIIIIYGTLSNHNCVVF